MKTPDRHISPCFIVAALLFCSEICFPTWAGDWPTYQQNNHRNAVTDEALPVANLSEEWVHESPSPPQPAWAGPAKWDAYASIRGLRSMRNYDPVFHTIVVNDSLFFGSSADDSAYCLDTNSGERKWGFTTGGPIRIAPTWWDSRLYFGSDDGYAYCVNAEDGELVWKFSPTENRRLVLNNGRPISFWPCRTGVLAEDGIAYFGASMLPWKESYLCAVDAETGRPEGEGRYVKRFDSLTLEGALLATSTGLIAPQGRVAPLVFNRRDGTAQGPLKEGGGGSFVMLTDDDHILHGPGNKTGWITDSNVKNQEKIASFKGGNAVVVDGNISYLLTDRTLAAVNRSTKDMAWKVETDHPFSLLVAGGAVVAGGNDEVAAYSAADGSLLWKGRIRGRAFGLAAADGALFVSTDEGAIHCFRPNGDSEYSVTGSSGQEKEKQDEESASSSAAPPAAGPFVRFTDPETAVVRWETKKPCASRTKYGEESPDRSVEDQTPKTIHEATLTGLRKNRIYKYTIQTEVDGKSGSTPEYELDNFFNYSQPKAPDLGCPFSSGGIAASCAKAAQKILAEAGIDMGVCVVLGSCEGHLAYELAIRSNLKIVVLESDPAKVRVSREALLETGLYGTRASVVEIASLSEIPLPSAFANLIVSASIVQTGQLPAGASEAFRLLRPSGGTLLLGQPPDVEKKISGSQLTEFFAKGSVACEIEKGTDGLWAKGTRNRMPGSGEWSHQYGRADNAAFAGEILSGAQTTEDLEVQWLGRPGPRYQPDRNGRKPAPLSTNGRLFTQGLHRIVGLDAYNGTILWSIEIPNIQRFNMPRDCSNWCADSDHVFAAIGDRCWRIGASDGDFSKHYNVVPGAKEGWEWDWGYVARHGNKVFGSAVKRGSAYINFWGRSEDGWYDATSGAATFKVCSDSLFALNEDTGANEWTYEEGVIINSTITIGGNTVFFVECRNPGVMDSADRRLGVPELWQDQYMVALDASSGRVLWEKPVSTERGTVMFHMAHGGGRLALVSSLDGQYHVYSYDASNGKAIWNSSIDWIKDNHGGHMSRPAIVGNTVYVRPAAFDLSTGERTGWMPGYDGGCATYAATGNAIFYRSSKVTMWDSITDQVTSWDRLRPDCWLSTIPACGMLLSPEAGGGCSCGSWMETSLAFMPKK